MGQNEQKYKVIFLGPAAKNFGLVDKLVNNLQAYFQLSAQNVTKMMRLAPITVKNGIDLKKAQRYKTVLEDIGAKVRIEPIDGVRTQGESTP
ncbi:MAG: hypothetical protein JRI46_10955 [Deltaproteobacteria bacterium]|nr:hypothetical protein [Deltaproteobacteria bacterium]